VIAITRAFDAPIARVWREWTEPECFADWFGGAQAEVPVSTVTMDVRVGGLWRATMLAGPDRREIRWGGEYREVDEPSRLAFTLTDDLERDVYELVTVILTDLDDGRTEMRFSQRGGGLTPEEYERAGQGWGGFFERMAAHLEAR
jgi:uncharacterized protein YndB with AHSA1/START domain